jgi:hypothetical protein
MSDAYAAPPPPPPPPPSPVTFDFVRPFAFVFEDARWVNKVLMGGLFQLAAFLLIGIPFLIGYAAKLARNVVAGAPEPLPEWDELSEKFAEGLTLVAAALLYVLPLILLFIALCVPFAAATGVARGISGHDFDPDAFGSMFAGVYCLMLPIGLAYAVWMPAALVHAMIERRFSAAFEFRRIWSFISGNIGNYLLALIVTLVARFAANFGIILFCIGIVFTMFWSHIVSVYAVAQAWRLSTEK